MSERLHSFHLDRHAATPELDDTLATPSGGRANSAIAAEAEQARAAVQAKGELDADGAVHEVASAGVTGSGEALPHVAAIQSSFGKYDVSGVRAHTGDAARGANAQLGATAFAKGNDIAFSSGSPDLHTAAHEAAHVIQQRAGVQLKGGVGSAGDAYERHADAVADRVVQGKSAEALLTTMAGPEAATGDQALQLMVDDAVQFLGTPLDQSLPEGAEKPEHGEDKDQRRYSVEQYIAMWEKEQGREMTARERTTLARGCIGITALNLSGGGNPPLDHAFAGFSDAHASMQKMNAALDGLRAKPETAAQAGNKHAVVFAKLFWSNQNANAEKRKKPDDKAFKPDTDGKVDMSGYEYRAQPGYINFDYGFWDETSQSFWHANHSQPGMKVYQSTLDRFSAGYMDFDRVIFCVGIAENYDPGLAAIAAGRGGG